MIRLLAGVLLGLAAAVAVALLIDVVNEEAMLQ